MKKKKLYLQQKKRFLKKIIGSTEKPRLAVFRSHKHIYAQVIDDTQGHTLASSSSNTSLFKNQKDNLSSSTKEAAFLIGKDIGQKAKEKKISCVVFDRSHRPYHGRIQSLAEGARFSGLEF